MRPRARLDLMDRRKWTDKKGVRALSHEQRATLTPEELAAYEADLAAAIRDRKRGLAARIDRAGRENSLSVRTVTGGLPTLGRR